MTDDTPDRRNPRQARPSSRSLARRAVLAAVLTLLALPAGASAHSILNGSPQDISYTTEDVTSTNCLSVVDRGNQVYFKDFDDTRNCVDAGITVSGDCSPGSKIDNNGYYYDGSCPRGNKSLIRIDVGPREDVVNTAVSLPIQILGGDGADVLTLSGELPDVMLGGPGNDTLDSGGGSDQIRDEDGADTVRAGTGNDIVQGGRGEDSFDAGDGDDDVRSRDGAKDTIVCGPGTDKVDADQLDEIAADCENVVRTQTDPTDGGSGDDTRAPKLDVLAKTMQRVGRTRKFFIAATMTERGRLATSGRLVAAGLFLPLKSKAKRVTVPGQGVELVVRLGRRAMRAAKRSWRRGRRVYVRMDVVATDEAGNSATRKAPRIFLKR